jgi:drug/metabolite transporter (DMT)-like permease
MSSTGASPSPRRGILFALGSALLFGLTAPFSKILLGRIDPQMLAGLLYLGAGLGLAALHGLRLAIGSPEDEAPLRRSDAPWLAGAGIAGGLLAPLLLMEGLRETSAANASLLLNLESLATMAIAWLAFRENVDARLLAGAAAILAGAVVLSWRGEGLALDRGALLVAGACLLWGVDNNLTRKVSASDPVRIATVKGFVAGAANIAGAFALGATAPGALDASAATVLGFLGIGLSLVLFILALRGLGAARTSAWFSAAPFVGALAAILLLGEQPHFSLLVAGALMGFGLWLHLSERHEHWHEHAPVEHEHAHVHDAHHRHGHDGPVSEPHSHRHRHDRLVHSHPHYPDLHHRHSH